MLLTNDAENKRGLDAGLKAQSIHAHSLAPADEFADPAGDDRGGRRRRRGVGVGRRRRRRSGKRARFGVRRPAAVAADKGRGGGRLHQGKLHVNRHNGRRTSLSTTTRH